MRAQIILLMLGIAVTGSNSLVLSPILADVAQGLATTPVAVSRALAAYGGATALSAFLLAPRIDRVGPRRALTAGMAAMTLAMLLSAFAGHWLILVLAQTLAGIGAGVVLPSIYALATSIAPKGSEAAVLGRVLTGWSPSLVVGVPASALIADFAGWRASFLALGVLAGASLAGTVRLPEGHVAELEPAGPLAALAYPTVPPLLLVWFGFMAAFYCTYAFIGDAIRAATGVGAATAGLVVLTYGHRLRMRRPAQSSPRPPRRRARPALAPRHGSAGLLGADPRHRHAVDRGAPHRRLGLRQPSLPEHPRGAAVAGAARPARRRSRPEQRSDLCRGRRRHRRRRPAPSRAGLCRGLRGCRCPGRCRCLRRMEPPGSPRLSDLKA
jgi:hypothetical protein